MAETKRATIFYGGFAFRGGGAFNHAKLMREALQLEDWDVALITLECLPAAFRYLPHVVGKISNWLDPPMGFYFKDRLTRFFYKHLLARRAQLHIFEDIYLSWNSNVPSVTVLHAVWSDNLQSMVTAPSAVKRLVRAEELTIDSIAHPVITVSQAYLDHLKCSHQGAYGISSVVVVPLGLDVTRFDGVGEPERPENSLVYCGSLEARKNLSLLLRVFKSLYASDASYRLTIIGDGPDRDHLERYALQNLLPVTFRGRLSPSEVVGELTKHSLYVHPSLKESFSFALLEAKLAGLRTVAFIGLEVPREFIDVPVDSFDEAAWITSIRSAHLIEPVMVNRGAYSSNAMMHATLQLAFQSR